MKVFGIGLNKTGTSSLGKALEILGFNNHVSWSPNLVKKWSEDDIDSIISVAYKFNNFEDFPWPLVYKELYNEFDDAKFILTKRPTPEIWFNSQCKHSINIGPNYYRKLIYGNYMPHDFKAEHFDFYNNHNQQVIDFFRENDPDKLLVISFEDGNNWEKICEFLNKDIPKTEFPFLNKASKNNSQLETITIKNKNAVKLIKTILAAKNYSQQKITAIKRSVYSRH